MILKSSHMNGDASLFRKENRELLIDLLQRLSEKYHIKIVEYELVGNHIHILFKIACRSLYRKFIRCLTGQFAKKMIQRFGLKRAKNILCKLATFNSVYGLRKLFLIAHT